MKTKYGLWVTSAERAAMYRILQTCPGEQVPTGGNPTGAAVGGSPTPPAATPPGSTSARTDPDMDTCTAAKAAGYGPYFRGRDPEYDYYVDRDGDGEVCE